MLVSSRSAAVLIASICAFLLFVAFTREFEPSSIVRLKNSWSHAISPYTGQDGGSSSSGDVTGTGDAPLPESTGQGTTGEDGKEPLKDILPTESDENQPEIDDKEPTTPKIDPLKYLISIRDFNDKSINRVSCPMPDEKRYGYLQDLHFKSSVAKPPPYRPYFIAINLHQCAPVLPRLLGSLIQVIRVLGPQNVALSIIEGRSTDGTYEVLSLLNAVLPAGTKYFFSTSNINPWEEGRIGSLATLRNLAIEPLVNHSTLFSVDNTTVIFLNDVAACPDDMLELVHQKFHQGADMTCGMDWNIRSESGKSRLTFYDVWIARSMSGQSFFHIPYGGAWNESMNLFSFDNDADRLSKERFDNFLPFQVFTCWNGGVVFDAKAVMVEDVRFRINREDECYQGEVSLFVKELWLRGHGKIAVVPSVNLAYEDKIAKRIQKEKGLVSKWAKKHQNNKDEKIQWQLTPPEKILCIPNWVDQLQYWVPWNE